MSTLANTYILANAGNFPAESIPYLRERLEEMTEEEMVLVMATELKNPTVALLFSLFFGTLGVDRFYIGDVGLGIAKLLFSWATFGIWTMIDWFVIMGATKARNLERVNQVMTSVIYRW